MSVRDQSFGVEPRSHRLSDEPSANLPEVGETVTMLVTHTARAAKESASDPRHYAQLLTGQAANHRRVADILDREALKVLLELDGAP